MKVQDSHIIFFEPTPEFIQFVNSRAAGRPIIDVGAGAGLLSAMLVKEGHKVLAVDILERDDPIHPVHPLDATFMSFPEFCLPICARPCHSEWIDQFVDNAMTKVREILYVGLEHNFAQDLGEISGRYQLSYEPFVAGLDGERVVVITAPAESSQVSSPKTSAPQPRRSSRRKSPR